MNILELIEKTMKTEGYDGLFNSDGECACLGDAPCGDINGQCKFGYFKKCTPEEKEEFGFMIGEHKSEEVERIVERYDRDFSFKCLVNGMLLDARISVQHTLKEQIWQLSEENIKLLLRIA